MSYLNTSDFYYGAVLSKLFNQGIMDPSLIEGNDDYDRQVYDFTTDSGEYRLFMKYSKEKKGLKKSNNNSWGFNITGDYQELNAFIEKGKNVVLALVCGSKNLANSELALLNKEQILQIINAGKMSFTISRKKNEKSYRIRIEGPRESGIKVRCNSFEELFH